MTVGVREWARGRPLITGAVGAVVLFLLLVVVYVLARPAVPAPVLVPVAVACAALVGRQRWPVPTLALVGGVALLAIGSGKATELLAAPVLVAVYTVAARTSPRTTVLVAVPAGFMLVGMGALLDPGPGLTLEHVSWFAWIGMAAAVGDAVRSGRAYFAAMAERAERAERTREEEARRRVVEERLRIARELHDVVAHHIAVVNVQAGVAGHLLTTRPDEAAAAMGHIRRASRTVLDELSGLLSVLRETADPAAPTAPAPGMADVAGLIEGFRGSGLHVACSVAGDTRTLPSAVDVVAYRLVQEALTNAHRHGAGTAALSVVRRPTQLTLEIINGLPATSARSPGVGLGLIGMRERAAAVGGTVSTGPDVDAATFRVRAVLPLTASEAAPGGLPHEPTGSGVAS
ncbi:MAG TPA: histidine kinase [Pseudonocardia sp.]